MNNYYEDILQEISVSMDEGRYADAEYLIRRELSMPYIPAEAETQLRRYADEVRWRISENSRQSEWSTDVILERLYSDDPVIQLAAAAKLCGRSLREFTDDVRKWLAADPYPDAAALIMDALAEQQVNDEFVYVKDGTEYTFWGDALTPVSLSEGFRTVYGMLGKHYSKDLARLQMAREILVHACYGFLPLSYEADDAEMLFREVTEQLKELFPEEKN